ncbi:uncharacterized protein BDV17DRAFT_275475 [Aspergillus undulatus]|uniref:uncharacterized protein n=1 Tax=Aspergillus undulatus TaxID=1810928 RepID=UPI003CCD9544
MNQSHDQTSNGIPDTQQSPRSKIQSQRRRNSAQRDPVLPSIRARSKNRKPPFRPLIWLPPAKEDLQGTNVGRHGFALSQPFFLVLAASAAAFISSALR